MKCSDSDMEKNSAHFYTFVSYNMHFNIVSFTIIIIIIIIICAGGKIEKNEMDGACGAYGGGERCAQGSGGVT